MSTVKRTGLATTRNKYRFRRAQDALFARSNQGALPESPRSVLHYRTARARTKSLLHRKPLALLSNAIFANMSFDQLRAAKKHFDAHRAKISARKPRPYLALKNR